MSRGVRSIVSTKWTTWTTRTSARERQVLALIAEGLSHTDVAQRLTISEKTVRNQASNLFDKLGVWSRAQAIVFAPDHGFNG